MLGSSARKLETAGTNLYGGRALLRVLHPLVPAELGAAFDLERAPRSGTVPLVWTSEQPREVLESTVCLPALEHRHEDVGGCRPGPPGDRAVAGWDLGAAGNRAAERQERQHRYRPPKGLV